MAAKIPPPGPTQTEYLKIYDDAHQQIKQYPNIVVIRAGFHDMTVVQKISNREEAQKLTDLTKLSGANNS